MILIRHCHVTVQKFKLGENIFVMFFTSWTSLGWVLMDERVTRYRKKKVDEENSLHC